MAMSQINLTAVFSVVSDAILVFDERGRLAAANPAAEQLTGFREAELAETMTWQQLCGGISGCSADASCSEWFAEMSKHPSAELRIAAKGGREITVAANGVVIRTEAGIRYVLVMREMAGRQKAERLRFQRQFAHYVIRAQEEERRRIARELHDGVGQTLYSILVGLKVLDQLELAPPIQNQLAELKALTYRLMNQVNDMAVELRPYTLDDLGLLPAIRSYGKRFEQTYGIKTRLQAKGEPRRYAAAVETALYRICLEALSNVAKYAGTERVEITLDEAFDRIILAVRDFGKGFVPDQVIGRDSALGLYGMRERADLLGGRFLIESVPGKGTTIQTIIPLTEKEEPRYDHPDTDR